jgi:hypothetical protein
LTCIRDDGSTVGQTTTDFFVRHDLTHYAVETTLDFSDAFWGLLNQGWDISSFEEREPGTRKARSMPAEALRAETLVATYDLERTAGILANSDRLGLLGASWAGAELPTEAQLDRIREVRSGLFAQWHALGPGETLEFPFPNLHPDSV